MLSHPPSFHHPGCGFRLRELLHTVVDLGMSPLCESYLTREQLNQMGPFYPLHVYVCGECCLVQLEAYVSAEHIFSRDLLRHPLPQAEVLGLGDGRRGRPPPAGDVMIFQGPPVIDWRRGKFEDGSQERDSPPAPDGLDCWLRANGHVRGRPEWVFVKGRWGSPQGRFQLGLR